MKNFIPKTSTPVPSIALLVVFFCSLFVFQVSATKADASPETVWVLTETQVNPYDGQLEFYGGGATPGWFGEARFEGTFIKYAVTETSFRIDDRYVDHEFEHHNVTIETYFEKPPLKLTPGETIELIYGFSHSGTVVDSGTRVQFWYDSEDVDIQPDTVFAYAPWSEDFDGTADGRYSFVVPAASSGSEIELYAGWWNAEPCLVIWKYQAQEVSGMAVGEAASDQDDLPEWVKNGQAYIDVDGQAIYVPDWLEWIKPERIIKRTASLEPWGSGGEIWIYNRAFRKWQGPIKGSYPLYSGDIVFSGPGTSAGVIFTNRQGAQDTIAVGSDTLLEVPSYEKESDYPTLWRIYDGAIRIKNAALRDPSVYVEPSPFIIWTPTVVTGSRGTDFVVLHNPEAQTSSIYLISDELDYYNLAAAGPEDAILTAGLKLVVTGDGKETTLPIDDAELESIMASNNIQEIELLNPEELKPLFPEEAAEGNQDASRPNDVLLAIFGAIICILAVLAIGAVIAIFVLLLRKKAT